jgi:predicted nucleotidyltransferase
LQDCEKIFFSKLENYLDTKVYYYGSIQRYDYIETSSDIDVAVFTNNTESTLLKMQSFLNKKRSDFKKFVFRLNLSNKIAYGYKVKYVDPNKLFTVEFAIYSENLKSEVLIEQYSKCDIPFYITVILYIIKLMYYKLHILSYESFFFCKKIFLNYLIVGNDAEYIVLHE